MWADLIPEGSQTRTEGFIHEKYRFDEDRSVWVRPDALRPFNYSDGDDVENRLFDVVSSAGDVRSGSSELAANITDWPTEYHLSPKRANLLRPLIALLRGELLEIGAGCGALTRYLGELGGNVTAVEGSLRRSQIAASRCRGLNNVQVVCESFEDFETGALFDSILLIGVLEYCRLFSPDAKPESILARCRGFLKPGGRLILSLENQLGLKYFCAAPEDHLGVPYFGIEDRYHNASAITWGRQELLSILQTAGWNYIQELYPFPDYKLPELVATENSLSSPDLLADLLRQYGPAHGNDREYLRAFSESAAWPVIVRNGLVNAMTNSFLIIASNAPQPELRGSFIYSASRCRAFQKQTWVGEIDGEATVTRKAMYDDSPPESSQFAWRLGSGAFKAGPVYAAGLERILIRPDWSKDLIIAWAKPYYDFLSSHVLPETAGSDTVLIPAEFLDCGPQNLILGPDGRLEAFDLEWLSLTPLPLKFVLFRSLLVCFTRCKAVAPTRADDRLLQLISDVSSAFGHPFDDHEFTKYIGWEADFQSFARGYSVKLSLEEWRPAKLRQRLPGTAELANVRRETEHLHRTLSSERTRISEMQIQLENADRALQDQQNAMVQLERRLVTEQEIRFSHESRISMERDARVAIENSASWRVTAPLRKVKEWFDSTKK